MTKKKETAKGHSKGVHVERIRHCPAGSLTVAPALDLESLCIRLQEFQVERKFAISLEKGIVQRVSARVVRAIGVAPDTGETARTIAWKRAEGIVRNAFAGKAPAEADAEIAAVLQWQLEAARRALEPISLFRTSIEKDMDATAAQLPGLDIIEHTPGFATRGLAVIVGEAGNLSNYSTERKLWRRLGLGTAPGHEAHAYSTWRRIGLPNGEWEAPSFPGEPLRAGYAPARLGQIYGVVTIPLFMSKSKNKYGAVYDARRARTALTHPLGTAAECKADPNRWTKAHGDMDARRIMTKSLISDLWSEWRRSGGSVNANEGMASAKTFTPK